MKVYVRYIDRIIFINLCAKAIHVYSTAASYSVKSKISTQSCSNVSY